jgi:hypothetical protein
VTNLELAIEKLEAARVILAAVDAYHETCGRLIAEANKLGDEAEALLQGDEDGQRDDGHNETDRGAVSAA